MKKRAKVLKAYVLPFSGLKLGLHHFELQVEQTFLEAFEWEEPSKIEIDLQIHLEKRNTMLTLDFDLKGVLEITCDRCSKPLEIVVDSSQQLLVKFGSRAYEETDDIIILPEGAYEIDVSQYVYEYLRLAVPMRKVHELDDCDPEVVKHLSKVEPPTPEEDPEIDPRWSGLQNWNPDNGT